MKNNLKAIREASCLTQEELCEKSGVSRTVISTIENGKADSITTRTMLALADALGVRLSDIFFLE